MSFAIGLGGIVVALVFLTAAVYKGWSILYSSIISVIIIAVTNGLNLYEALTVNYVSSFTSHAASYFILFCEGAMLGKLYDASGAAWKIGKTVVDKCGTKFALIGYIAVAAVLEYGGISTFVICFVSASPGQAYFQRPGPPLVWAGHHDCTDYRAGIDDSRWSTEPNIIPTQILGTRSNSRTGHGCCIYRGILCDMWSALCVELKRAKNVEWKRNSLPPCG